MPIASDSTASCRQRRRETAATASHQTNLADHPELAGVQADPQQRLLAWMQQTRDPILDGPIASPYYPRALARLRDS
jgi:hypothetical protein